MKSRTDVKLILQEEGLQEEKNLKETIIDSTINNC